MRFKYGAVLVGLLALLWFTMEHASGGRGGRGGGARGGGGRAGGAARVGGGAGGGARTGGAVVGPYGGAGAGSRTGGTVVGPAGGSRTVGGGSGSYTGPRGGTIEAGGAGRTVTGPGGATAGRGIGGVQVTGPGGQTAGKVGTAGGVKGPGGAGVAGGRTVGGTTGPLGTGVGASRGGAAVGPSGGVAAGGARVGAGAGPYGGYVGGSRGVTVGGAAGHYTNYRSAAAIRTQGSYVRTGFRGYSYFNPGWYTAHPGAWFAAGWAAGNYWRWAPYTTISTFCGYPAIPVVYDYGANLVYEDNRVYYNGELVAAAEDYAAQAADLAAAGQAAKTQEKEEWQSLGVFGLVQGEEKEANNIFQLAINKDGVIRGNYYNVLTDSTSPVFGSVDKKSQRAAWSVGDKKEPVFETGVGNLAEPETAVLVHFGKDRTQQMTLVRMEQPKEEK
jgi:hypothetical protein